jgi:hypothetical protein
MYKMIIQDEKSDEMKSWDENNGEKIGTLHFVFSFSHFNYSLGAPPLFGIIYRFRNFFQNFIKIKRLQIITTILKHLVKTRCLSSTLIANQAFSILSFHNFSYKRLKVHPHNSTESTFKFVRTSKKRGKLSRHSQLSNSNVCNLGKGASFTFGNLTRLEDYIQNFRRAGKPLESVKEFGRYFKLSKSNKSSC